MGKSNSKSFLDIFLKIIKPVAMFFIYIAVLFWFLFLLLFNRKKFKEEMSEKSNATDKKKKSHKAKMNQSASGGSKK